MSNTQTATISPSTVQEQLHKLSLNAEDDGGNTLLKGPIKPSGAFEAKYGQVPFIEQTPVIGRVYESELQLEDLLAPGNDNVLRDLALIISTRGVVLFKNQRLSAEGMQDFVSKLHKAAGAPPSSGLHIHPSVINFKNEGVETPLTLQKISSKSQMAAGGAFWRGDTRQFIASAGWHSDISWEPNPSDYSVLKLTELPPVGGDTHFASAEELYNRLSPPFAAFLETLTATHAGTGFIEEAKRHNSAIIEGPRGAPANKNTHLSAVHPVIRTNPVTGKKAVFVNKSFTKYINGVTPHESELILKFLFELMVHNHDLQTRIRWSQNDTAVWDNVGLSFATLKHCLKLFNQRSNWHNASFDFGDHPRTGDRACSCGEKPFFDPNYGKET